MSSVVYGIKAGEPTLAGDIYTEDVLTEMIEKIKKFTPIIMDFPMKSTIDITQIIGYVKNIRLLNGELHYDAQFLSGRELYDGSIKFTLASSGTTVIKDSQKFIEDCELICLYPMPTERVDRGI